MKTHKDLIVWQKSIDFVSELYKETSNFPKEEQYGLVSQMRRAAVSVPSNIAEGAARNSDKELLRFLHIARGSASELETQLLISENLGYMEINQNKLKDNLIELSKMLTNLIHKINQRIKSE